MDLKILTPRRGIQVLVWIVALCALSHSDISSAQLVQRASVFQGLYHTGWSVRDGAPPDINDLVQTSDGYLWLATKNGLYHFDGVRFERFTVLSGPKLLEDDVTALLALPDGGLWIGYASGGASLLEHGQLQNLSKEAGLDSSTVLQFARSPEGVLWVATLNGLSRLQGKLWKKIGVSDGFTCPRVNSLAFDDQATLWVACETTVLLLRHDQTSFSTSGISFSDSVGLAPGRDGTMWASGIEGRVMPLHHDASLPVRSGPSLAIRSDTSLLDREGRLWVATTADGLRCVSLGERRSWYDSSLRSRLIDSFSKKAGLTSDEVTRVFEDREGNVWVTTTGGLDRFRRTKLTSVALPSGASGLAILAGSHGSVLVSTGAVRPGMEQVDENGTLALKDAPDFLTCAYHDVDGSIWLGGMRSLWHNVNGKNLSVSLPAEVSPRATVQTIVRSSQGELWVSFANGRSYRLRGKTWTLAGRQQNWPETQLLFAFNDQAGSTWYGFEGDVLAVVSSGPRRVLSKDAGLQVGDVTAITEHNGRLWVGGSHGVQMFDHGRFYTLRDDAQEFKTVSGIVRTSSQGLWLNEAAGVVNIPEEDALRFEHDHSSPVHAQLLSVLDGLPGTPYPRSRLPSAVESTDGVLWFTTASGLTHINPQQIFRNKVVPSVLISSITADHVLLQNADRLQLPKGTRNIQVDYTALSFSIPERVRFRYKLEGFDKEWIDAGSRRQAFYSQIPPGSYKFRVVACNDDGLWNEQGATAQLLLPPTFLQSLVFKLLCGGTLMLVLWSLYVMRLNQVTAQVRMSLYDRLSERERIARDLHDTFFQGIQGLLLRFHTGTRQLPADNPVRSLFEETLLQSDSVMREGRELVLDLRSGAVDSQDLARALATVSRQLRTSGTVAFEVTVTGTSRLLHPVVYEEVYRLGKEALSNAFQHSKARRIEAEVIYGAQSLKLSIRDDGAGVDPDVLRVGRRAGHWGLPGMRERAIKIGAQFDIWSRQHGGTEVLIKVPARMAYHGSEGPSRIRQFFNTSNQGDHLGD